MTPLTNTTVVSNSNAIYVRNQRLPFSVLVELNGLFQALEAFAIAVHIQEHVVALLSFTIFLVSDFEHTLALSPYSVNVYFRAVAYDGEADDGGGPSHRIAPGCGAQMWQDIGVNPSGRGKHTRSGGHWWLGIDGARRSSARVPMDNRREGRETSNLAGSGTNGCLTQKAAVLDTSDLLLQVWVVVSAHKIRGRVTLRRPALFSCASVARIR